MADRTVDSLLPISSTLIQSRGWLSTSFQHTDCQKASSAIAYTLEISTPTDQLGKNIRFWYINETFQARTKRAYSPTNIFIFKPLHLQCQHRKSGGQVNEFCISSISFLQPFWKKKNTCLCSLNTCWLKVSIFLWMREMYKTMDDSVTVA